MSGFGHYIAVRCLLQGPGVIDSEHWPDHVRLSDLEPKFNCQAYGHRGADVRPLFGTARMGTGHQGNTPNQ